MWAPPLTEIFALQRFKRGSAVKLRNGIMDFYLGLPHMDRHAGSRVIPLHKIPLDTWYEYMLSELWKSGLYTHAIRTLTQTNLNHFQSLENANGENVHRWQLLAKECSCQNLHYCCMISLLQIHRISWDYPGLCLALYLNLPPLSTHCCSSIAL